MFLRPSPQFPHRGRHPLVSSSRDFHCGKISGCSKHLPPHHMLVSFHIITRKLIVITINYGLSMFGPSSMCRGIVQTLSLTRETAPFGCIYLMAGNEIRPVRLKVNYLWFVADIVNRIGTAEGRARGRHRAYICRTACMWRNSAIGKFVKWNWSQQVIRKLIRKRFGEMLHVFWEHERVEAGGRRHDSSDNRWPKQLSHRWSSSESRLVRHSFPENGMERFRLASAVNSQFR